MKALLKKEFLLLHPAFYIGYLCLLMIFIPSYPHAVVFFMALTISINVYISTIVENNDMMFSSLILISKRDYVKAKLFMTLFFECSYMLLALPLLFIRKFCYPQDIIMNNPGLDSIISTYGYALLCYAFYNMVLLVIFFKAAPKRFMATGLSLLTAGLTFFFFGILIAYIPTIGAKLDHGGDILIQILYLLIGLLFFVLLNILTFHICAKEMDKKDL